MKRNRPYVLAQFSWTTRKLVLRMAQRAMGGELLKQSTTDPRKAFRWASRQAALQFLNRLPKYSQTWEVLDLRRVRARPQDMQ